MFDIGWSELLIIALVALIVVGPKDLPMMFKTLGKFTAKARRMARDFQRAMEDAADEAGVKEAASTLKSATNPKNMGLDALNSAAEKFDKWDPKLGSRNKSKPAKSVAPSPDAKVAEQPAATPEGAQTGDKAAADARSEVEKPATDAGT